MTLAQTSHLRILHYLAPAGVSNGYILTLTATNFTYTTKLKILC